MAKEGNQVHTAIFGKISKKKIQLFKEVLCLLDVSVFLKGNCTTVCFNLNIA